MTRYGLRLPDGHLVTDPEWRSPADVMRGAHGQGTTRVTGELVKIPERIQRRRTPGWRMPDGAVYVGRPSRWGNPFGVEQANEGGWYVVQQNRRERWWTPNEDTKECAATLAVKVYRGEVGGFWNADFRAAVRRELAGRDLACWCPLDSPCHADVLLDVANRGEDR